MDMSFMNNIGSFTIIITTLPFVIIALIFFYIWLRGRRASSITKTWPMTSGRVLRSQAELRRSSSSHGGTAVHIIPP